MKKALFFVLLFVLSISFSFSQTYITPEEVIRYFVENIKNGNIDNTIKISIYDKNNLLSKINPTESIKYFNSVILATDYMNLPTQFSTITKYNLLASYASQIKRFIFCLLLDDVFPNTNLNIDVKQVNENELNIWLFRDYSGKLEKLLE